jgi:hypothetical protein
LSKDLQYKEIEKFEVDLDIENIPTTPLPEPALLEVSNQPVSESSESSNLWDYNGFTITIDKYADVIRIGYKSDKLFLKALHIADTNSINHLEAVTGHL